MCAIQNMVFRIWICLSCIVAGAFSYSAPSGANGGYTLNLQPPEENTRDVVSSLDAIMVAETEKRTLSDAEFSAAKQRLIDIEKQRIHDIIAEAFESAARSA